MSFEEWLAELDQLVSRYYPCDSYKFSENADKNVLKKSFDEGDTPIVAFAEYEAKT